MKISVCGKGGSGKSTVVSLLANAAQARGFRTLVVDSDESNSGLFRMLGFANPPPPLITLVGGKEGIKDKPVRHVQSIRKAEKILKRLLLKTKNKDRE